MFRSLSRKTLLTSALVVATLATVHGSAGAQPAPDYTGDYSEPYWIYANPADDASAERILARFEFDEDNPAPNWDAGVAFGDTRVVSGR